MMRLIPLCMLSLMLAAVPAAARDLAVPRADLVKVEVTGVGVDPLTGSPAVLLRDPDSEKIVPIFIGPIEAEAVDRALRGVRPPRPLTHELMGDLMAATGAELVNLIIDELREGTYLAVLELKLRNGQGLVLIDTRPSDGMALALRNGSPILVARKVLRAQDEIEPPPRERAPEVLTRVDRVNAEFQ